MSLWKTSGRICYLLKYFKGGSIVAAVAAVVAVVAVGVAAVVAAAVAFAAAVADVAADVAAAAAAPNTLKTMVLATKHQPGQTTDCRKTPNNQRTVPAGSQRRTNENTLKQRKIATKTEAPPTRTRTSKSKRGPGTLHHEQTKQQSTAPKTLENKGKRRHQPPTNKHNGGTRCKQQPVPRSSAHQPETRNHPPAKTPETLENQCKTAKTRNQKTETETEA